MKGGLPVTVLAPPVKIEQLGEVVLFGQGEGGKD